MTAVLLRGAVGYALLASLGIVAAEPLANLFLPLLRWELAVLLPDFTVLKLAVERPSAETIIAVSVEIARPVNLGGIWPPGQRVDASTLLGHMVQPGIVCCAVLIALPAAGVRDVLRRLAWGAAFSAVALPLDVPVVLAGAIVDVLSSAMPPPGGLTHPWVMAMNFINGGGRALLGVSAALLALAVAGRFKAGVAKSSSCVHHVVTS